MANMKTPIFKLEMMNGKQNLVLDEEADQGCYWLQTKLKQVTDYNPNGVWDLYFEQIYLDEAPVLTQTYLFGFNYDVGAMIVPYELFDPIAAKLKD